jgi:sugar-specific transcriptional regulator TrmB
MTLANLTVEPEYLYVSSTHKNLISSLVELGLTQNEAKIYMYLTKNRSKSAPEISICLKIPRTETYHLLNGLQSKEVAKSNFGKPTKFTAVPFDKSIQILVNKKRSRLQKSEREILQLSTLWKSTNESEIKTQ